MPARQKPEEDLARVVVETLDAVQLDPTDVAGAPDGTCDFAVWRNGRIAGALEVTTLVDENRARFDGALYAQSVLDAPELCGSWYIALSKEALAPRRGVNELRSKVIPALAELESRGLDDFQRDDLREFRVLWGEDLGEPLLMHNLPINFAHRDPEKSKPRVFLMGPSAGSTVWSGNAHAAVEEALTGPRFEGERKKLDRTGHEERHLFVWVGVSLFDAYVGIASEDKPADAIPSLPNEITHLWLAAEGTEGPVVWTSRGPKV